jgi:4-alpha-glucanotransferase
MERSSGVLMPMSSLPSPYGIGTMGKSAYEFIDFLKAAGQRWWQLLPLGITDASGSPYSSVSAFAGNPNYIDLDMLAADGLIDASDLALLKCADERAVDYDAAAKGRGAVLSAALLDGREKYGAEFRAFKDGAGWLRGYALYAALKSRFGGLPWYEWPEELKTRRCDAVAQAERELAEDIEETEFIQFLFFRQWDSLRAYAHENFVNIIGDIPIYVALDSADVWNEPQFFKLDEKLAPVEVAGVPPDYFSKDGQLWGNPIYDWERMRSDGWGWWIRRVDGASKLYDVVRIDHFRAFASYWAVPCGEKTAKNGVWRQGPGMELVGTLENWFRNTKFIAEDLGVHTPDVGELLEKSGLPGMKVLEFAFSPDGSSDHLPHKFTHNCVCYSGTHDNDTILGWLESRSEDEREFAEKYMAINSGEGWCWGMLRCGMASVADVYIAQMQDLLKLDGSCRMNTPGTAKGNWRWRMLPGECTAELAAKLYGYTKLYGR